MKTKKFITFTSLAGFGCVLFGASPCGGASAPSELVPVLSGESVEASAVVTAHDRPVWWTWTAPFDGRLVVHTEGSNFDTWLGVYLSDGLTTRDAVAANDNAVGRTTSEVSFQAAANTTYRIGVAGAGFGLRGQVQLRLNLRRNEDVGSVIGANDFLERRPLDGFRALGLAHNTRSNRQTSEPSSGGGEKTVWWSWTAPADGLVTIDTLGSEFDTVLKTYAGESLDALSPVRWNHDAGGEVTSLVRFPAKKDVVYQICVDHASIFGLVGGNIVLNLELVPSGSAGGVVGADNFNRRLALEGSDALGMGNLDWATAQPGEPRLGEGKTLWWTWEADTTGPVVLTTEGSEFNTILAVYTGDQVDQLRLLASNDDQSQTDGTSRLKFEAVRGEAYQIAVSRTHVFRSSTIGNVTLTLRQDTSLRNEALLQIEPAVRLAIFAKRGIRYQLQRSADLQQWHDLAEPLLGNDRDWEWFVPHGSHGKSFFRVLPLNASPAREP